ncbi:MAG: urate oxidase [Acidobacteria bacterium]|nr:urate oxidase [Acidobacteriota bacterium]
MTVRIVQNNYGKSRVRLIKVARAGEHHDIQDLNLNIALEGDFDDIHITGDNTKCLPTDTMKNTVYALAGQYEGIEEAEAFGQRLASYFLDQNAQVRRVRLDMFENGWKRMKFEGRQHDHSFVKGSRERRTIDLDATRNDMTIEAGVEDLIVLKTTHSGFSGFIKDKYTTLPEVDDRIFATAIKGKWRYMDPSRASEKLWADIRQTILKVFAGHESLSVQHTLYAMGEAVLDKFEAVAEVSFSLPNIHCIPFDVSKFGVDDHYAIFVPTDEPHGLIEARLAR